MMRRVLAVDDSLTMRELLRQALAASGFDVTTASDGVEALELLADTEPDLIVTDLNMPRMDGFELVAAVRCGSISPRVPILIVTTETGQTLREKARTLGATGWVSKPFDEARLLAAVRRVLSI